MDGKGLLSSILIAAPRFSSNKLVRGPIEIRSDLLEHAGDALDDLLTSDEQEIARLMLLGLAAAGVSHQDRTGDQ